MTDERPTVFKLNDKLGLRQGEKTILEPRHESIGEFVGGLSLIDNRFFVDEHGNVFKDRKRNGDVVLELMPGGIAKVMTVRNEIVYRDWMTDEVWETKPEEVVKLNFLYFIKVQELYYLRIKDISDKVAFHESDLWIKSDVFQRHNALNESESVFIHRLMPNQVFLFLGYDKAMSKRLRPYLGGTHYYTYKKAGTKPTRTKDRLLPIDTEEYRMDQLNWKLNERDMINVARMKRLTPVGRGWMTE